MVIRLVPLCVGLGLAILCSPASAATLITKTSNTANQTFEASTGPHLIDLGEGNGTALHVSNSAPARLAILFNAECSVAAADRQTWLIVEILVDGTVVSPSGAPHAFCTSDGDSTLDNWVTAASDVSVDVAAGTHTIALRSSLGGGSGVAGQDWWIGDLSLIVIMNEL